MVFKTLEESVRDTPFLSIKVPLSYTEALENSHGKPMIIRQAEGLKKVLENLPIIIRPDELIVGTFDEKIPVAIPRMEGSGFRILNELEKLPNRSLNPIIVNEEDIKIIRDKFVKFYENFKIDTYATEIAPKKVFELNYSGSAYVATEIGGIAHAVIDYPRLLSMGLNKYIQLSNKNIKKYKQMLVSDIKADEKVAFYKAIRIICKALIDYANKYADEAEKLANMEKNPKRKEELLSIAATCRQIPANPPKNLQEAVQFLWFIHMALHVENFEHGISFGRVDQYLLPYYDGNKDKALRLFKNLILKTNEIIALYDGIATQYFGGMATTQNILISGVDDKGNDVTNELTYIFLKAIDEAAVPSPNLVVRVHKNTPSKIFQEIARILSRGKNVIGIYNDDLVIESLIRCGVSPNEAHDYGIVGCVGLSTTGTSFDNTGAIFLNLAKALELALGTDTSVVSKYIENNPAAVDFSSMDELLEMFLKKLKDLMKMATLAANAYQQAHKKLKPTPLMSLCIRDCFEKGQDVNEGPAKYNFSGIHVTGFSDVVDSLAAIDWAVFKEKKITLKDLINALKKNFRGNKEIYNYLVYKCPKYGNDDERADIYAKKVIEILYESVEGLKSSRGGNYRVGIHAMTTHVGFGLFTGALPSGRKKGKPLTRDIAPGFTGEKGLTAALNSISKFDHSLLCNGVACTININPEIPKMEDGKIFESILRTYVKLKGSHIQFNSISLDMLKEAQENPDKHKDLMVRVSGYSARFIDLPKAVQDDIIARYCYSRV